MAKRVKPRRILEEEEYLDRMAKIIRRDFFPDISLSDHAKPKSENGSSYLGSNRTFNDTPGTGATQYSTTSSLASREESTSLKLDAFLDRYTSEDNAYFEKLQRRDLKRHKHKYPWLYQTRKTHSSLEGKTQLKLQAAQTEERSESEITADRFIDWPHNPRSSLFFPPADLGAETRSKSTINYNSNRTADDSIFKVPAPRYEKSQHINRMSDKIGIDGKLLNGSETPMINGYSFLPAPETPVRVESVVVKSESNRFYIPNESPRDELAHRIYQDRVAKVIKTPKSGPSPGNTSHRTPLSTKRYAEFSFSPERVKTCTPRLKK